LRLEATAVIGMPLTSSEALLKFPALPGTVLQLFVSVKQLVEFLIYILPSHIVLELYDNEDSRISGQRIV
jgi:hypothetical protein